MKFGRKIKLHLERTASNLALDLIEHHGSTTQKAEIEEQQDMSYCCGKNC
jgi:hypothetical protein